MKDLRKDIKDKIKTILKDEAMTWEKLAELDGGKQKGSYRQKVITKAETLQETFGILGYEIIFKKVK